MKKTLRRLMSVALVVVMVATLFIGSALAATSCTKSVTSSNPNNMTSFSVTTGKGISYSLGLKKTTISIKNTGSGDFTIYQQTSAGLIYVGNCGPGQTQSYTVKGSNKKVVFKCQKGLGNPKAQVTVSAGSVS